MVEEEEGEADEEIVNIDSPPIIYFCSRENFLNGPFTEVELDATRTVDVDRLHHLARGGSVDAVLRMRTAGE